MDMKGETEFSLAESSSMYSYQWSFGGRPLREFLLFNELNSGLASCSDKIRFRSGILFSTAHHFKLFIDETGEVYVKMYIGRTILNTDNAVNCVDFTDCVIHKANVVMTVTEKNSSPTTYQFEQLYRDEIAKLVCKRICQDQDIKAAGTNSNLFWFRLTSSASNFWGYCYTKNDILRRQNYITELNFRFQIFHRNWQKNSLQTKHSSINDAHLFINSNPNFKPGYLNTASLFLSQDFSDFVIKCGSNQFPVHKVIIANVSPVLAAMLQQPLKEVQEGFMTITDSEPSTVEEFIKFIYTGTANVEEFAKELFIISDKYAVEELKTLSENVLVEKINGDNFFELCKVGKLVNSAALMNKCFKIFKVKKNDLIKTTEDIKRFSEEYPDLMLKLSQGSF